MGKKKPNKACHNSFYYFMMDFKAQQPRRFQNNAEVAEAAGPFWEKMSPAERKPYEDKAKNMKETVKVGKYTSLGVNIEVIRRKEQAAKDKEENMTSNIERIVAQADELGNLGKLVFHLIHVNYFCFCNSDERYYPAELAVVRVTLENGIKNENIFHIMIRPGDLPMGYTYTARQFAEETHGIQPPLGTGNVNNYSEVLERLMVFLDSQKAADGSFPPLYADNKVRPIIENVLSNICYDLDFPEYVFKVYSVQYFLFTLRNTVARMKVWPAFTVADMEFDKDVYEYSVGIACEYHETGEVLHCCSRSHVIRKAYVICDNCCGDLGIKLIPGVHLPLKSKVVTSIIQQNAVEHNFMVPGSKKSGSSVSESLVSQMSISDVGEDLDDQSFADASSAMSQYSWKHENEAAGSQPSSSAYNSQLSSLQALRSKRPTNVAQATLVGPSQSEFPPLAGPSIGRGRGRGLGAYFQNK